MNESSWWKLTPDEALQRSETPLTGLSPNQVQTRRERYGTNRLTAPRTTSWWRLIGRQFQNPLIYLLCMAASLAWIGGQKLDAFFIVLVLLLNATIGTVQEGQAERKSLALVKLIPIRSSVWRQKMLTDISSEELVFGDLVWLESGDRVPADLRLIQSYALETDESLLTGESMPVYKDESRIEAREEHQAMPSNMVFAGTLVVRGRARALVVATGSKTELGSMASGMRRGAQRQSSSQRRLSRFTGRLAIVVTVVGCGVFGVGVALRGVDWQTMASYAVALTVSIVPEGLPVALSVALAVAATKLARKGAILRHLPALESLGGATLLMMDKTGTLTENRIGVHRILSSTGDVYRFDVDEELNGKSGVWRKCSGNDAPKSEDKIITSADVTQDDELGALFEAAVLCNEATLVSGEPGSEARGDPTDIAILQAAADLGVYREPVLSRWPQVNQIPFEPEHRYAATFHSSRDVVSRAIVKGAPERVLQMCPATAFSSSGAGVSIDTWKRIASKWAREGDRVLAIGQQISTTPCQPDRAAPEPAQLTLLGLFGLRDTLRPEAKSTLAALSSSGIRIMMVTGDHPDTAFSVAQELGIARQQHEVAYGGDMLNEGTAEKVPAFDEIRVCARTSPEQKRRLVELARSVGHVVAVTGDGVNDAPALRAADIGISMGKSGTDVARESADLILGDDNLATLVDGVRCGRGADDNIRKVLFLLISTGAAEFMLVLLALIAGLPIPLLPVQLLWLNLVTNGIQDVALAFDEPETGVLERSPRPPQSPLFDAWLLERTLTNAVFIAVLGFAAFASLVRMGVATSAARNLLLLLLVLVENIQACQARSETQAFWKISWRGTHLFVLGVTFALAVHVVAMNVPILQVTLEVEAVSAGAFLACIAGAIVVGAFGGTHKWWWRLRTRQRERREAEARNLDALRQP